MIFLKVFRIWAAVSIILFFVAVSYAKATSYTDFEHKAGCVTGAYVATDILNPVFHEWAVPASVVEIGCFVYEMQNHYYPGGDKYVWNDLMWETFGVIGDGIFRGFTVRPMDKDGFQARIVIIPGL